MAAQKTANHLSLLRACSRQGSAVLLPVRSRSFATVSDVEQPAVATSSASPHPGLTLSVTPQAESSREQPGRTVLTTVYNFPSMEPERFAYYPSTHLEMPLRRDLLHRAIVYEGHSERQGTASTKWRDEVHGSGRKLFQQKGTGMARVGDKKSPIRRGGGVAFGPKPRDFSTELPRKIYDKAWRTALSHRYRQGELLIVDRFSNLPSTSTDFTRQMFDNNGWGRFHGKSLLIAEKNTPHNQVWKAMAKDYDNGNGPKRAGRIIAADDVDVKNLLETGRLIIEFRALNKILFEHASDLVRVRKSIRPVVEEEESADELLAQEDQLQADAEQQPSPR